ncbi:MAG TPA: PAS domain-containing protein [Candidatus Sulfotelmatobacter sp.]|nr:PAS domain-containing protein [Candidatus Sulfotelmatobacter sp.]
MAAKNDDNGMVSLPLHDKNGVLAERRSADQRRQEYWEEAQRLSHTGSFGWKPSSGEIIWSEETFRIFQYDQTTLPSVELVLQRVHPEDKIVVQKTLERVAQDGKDYAHEYRLLMPDGLIKHVQVVARALRDKSGCIEFVGAVMDVTAAKQAEKTLRDSETYLAEAQRLSHTGSWAGAPGMGEIRYWSEECYRLLGFDPQDGRPRIETFLQRIHADDQAKFKEAVETASRDKADFELDYRIVRPGGEVRDVHAIGHPVLSAKGDLVEFVGTVMDVTERKRSEALHEGEIRILEMIARDAPLAEILEKLVRLVEAQFTGLLCSVLILDEDGKHLRHSAAPNLPKAYSEAIDGLCVGPNAGSCGTAIYLRELVVVTDILEDPLWTSYRNVAEPHGLRACWSTPILSHSGNALGSFAMYYGSPHRPTLPEIRALEMATHLAGIAIERKLTQERLQRSEDYLAEAQRLSYTGSFCWRPSLGKIIWSEETFRIFQYAVTIKPDVQDILRRVHPEDLAAVRQTIEQATRDGKDFDHEYRLLMPDGSIKHIHVVAHGSRDESGNVEFIGAVMDVTQTKRVEKTLRESEAYLAEAQKLTHTGSGAWRVSDGDALYLSEEWYRIYGFDPQYGLSAWKDRLQRMHPEDQAKVEQIKEQAILEKSDYEVGHRIVLPDGSVKYTQTVGHPVFNAAGEVEQFVCTMMDVTERKKAEEAREALRQAQADLARVSRVTTMGELTASLAHEVNQPIAATVTDANTCLRWLAGDPPNVEEARAAAMRIVKDGRRAGEIVSRIRQLFQKGLSQRELVDVNEIIREMIVLLRGETMRYHILVKTDLAADIPRVTADRVQLQQVLMNLIINAIEATKDADQRRELTIISRRAESDQVIVSVNDTGVGLPHQHTEQIFEAFFTTKLNGTGMGLRISRSIIESHGGRLWAAHNFPRGASFHFTLPKALD